MKLHQILKEESAQIVLTKMATTIDPSVSNLNGYTNRSCFGKVAHFLKQNQNPAWYIMLFGLKSANEVTHCCLYDADGNRVVDTFDGEPQNNDGVITYVDSRGNNHELLASLTVQRFLSQFFKN